MSATEERLCPAFMPDKPAGHVECRRAAPESKHLRPIPAADLRDQAEIPRQARNDSPWDRARSLGLPAPACNPYRQDSIDGKSVCRDFRPTAAEGIDVRANAGQLFGNSESFDWKAAVNEAETRSEPIDPALKTARAGASASFGHETDFATREPALLGKKKSQQHQAMAGTV